MARPRGRTKTARISVSFEPHVYESLVLLAKRQDVPVAQIIRRAATRLVGHDTVPDISATAPSEIAGGRA